MASQQNSLYSTPAFEIFRRAYTVVAVTQFRGMNSYNTLNNVQPNYALDCLNVIVSGSGGLEKFRLPVALSTTVGQPNGPQYFTDFQYYTAGVPTRLLVGNYNNALYQFAFQPSGSLVPTLIEALANDNGPWSMVEASNILFMANGARMVKFLGTGGLENWGGAAPLLAPDTGAIVQANVMSVTINANVLSVATTTPSNFAAGDVVTLAGTGLAAANVTVTLASGGISTFTAPLIAANGVAGAGGTVTPNPGTGVLAFGQSWAYAYENSVTGLVTSRSPVTVSSGPRANPAIEVLTATAPIDPQFDTIQWYRTYDGGGNWYRVPNPANGNLDWPIAAGGLTLRDQFTDLQLDATIQGSLINNPPPVGKYLLKFQSRVLVLNLASNPQAFAWSGYEQILTGFRPEECFPPFNQVNLQIGAETIAGGGIIQSGVVVMSNTGRMWMLRGVLQDITTNAPVAWTDYLEELPFSIGTMSFNSIVFTPYGILWLASDKSLQMYNGSGTPQDFGQVIYPLLSSITPGYESLCVGTYLNWLEREWYALLIPVNGSVTLNKMILCSLQQQSQNVDIFVTDIQADFVAAVQTPAGQRQLLISKNGLIQLLKTQSVATGGIALNPTMTPQLLDAYWQSGYFGTDYPYRSKMFRQAILIADNQGFGAELRYVDHRTRTFRNPEIIQRPNLNTEIIELNRRAQLCSIKIIFPDADIDCGVLELRASYIGTADRQ